MEKVTPLKRFGQNYLTDNNILKKIIAEINPTENDFIVEVGPGTGALTSKLSESAAEIAAVEIDKRVKDDLAEKFPRIKFYNEDFLKTDLGKIFGPLKGKLRIAGNIPYNLTSPIIFKLLENNNLVKDAVFMVQHEVAKRISASPGSKDYGILSVLLHFFAEVKYCFKVSPNVFYPKPKVYSAVIHIFMKELQLTEEMKRTFISVVKASFGKRRKIIKNSLGDSIFKDIDFSDSGVNLALRAEQLNLKDFKILANFIINHPLHNSGR
ncbi:MAG TPA: 16S rRNA (adenine(1518)-N(6)/adenine(1519)-N(6))-dimethyltransferase RsmA [Ignavibacteriaceae bacterium]|nr:16S rRNA (adenine(1518)-N(6)/adenine(1519)-N(6))-dimethyltransferase RsmA [Ignavibacteriaceae bacterium]